MRAFGPRPAGARTTPPCPACQKDFAEGDYTTLIALGPGDDEEARQRAREARPYNAVGIEVHYACATGFEKTEAEHD
jgi:hypothetical protein